MFILLGFVVGILANTYNWSIWKMVIITIISSILLNMVIHSDLHANIIDDAVNTSELDKVNIDYKSYFKNGFSPYMIKGSVLNKELDLNVDFSLLEIAYFNQTVWSLVDQSQFRWVGYNPRLGIRLAPIVSVEFSHFSQHILDKAEPYYDVKFPVEDSVNIRINLFDRNPQSSLYDIIRN